MQKLLFPDLNSAPLLTSTDKGSCFECIWEDGVIIDTASYDLSNLEFICETLSINKMTDLAATDTGCIVISERLKAALLENGIDNLDYYPASIIERVGGTPKKGFYAVNILGLVECIDTKRSEFKGRTIDGQLRGIRRIHKLFLNTPPPTENYIYRAKFFRRLIVITDVLITLFESNEFSGVKLVEPSLWDGFSGEIST